MEKNTVHAFLLVPLVICLYLQVLHNLTPGRLWGLAQERSYIHFTEIKLRLKYLTHTNTE